MSKCPSTPEADRVTITIAPNRICKHAGYSGPNFGLLRSPIPPAVVGVHLIGKETQDLNDYFSSRSTQPTKVTLKGLTPQLCEWQFQFTVKKSRVSLHANYVMVMRTQCHHLRTGAAITQACVTHTSKALHVHWIIVQVYPRCCSIYRRTSCARCRMETGWFGAYFWHIRCTTERRLPRPWHVEFDPGWEFKVYVSTESLLRFQQVDRAPRTFKTWFIREFHLLLSLLNSWLICV